MTRRDYELLTDAIKRWYEVYNVSDVHFYGLVNDLTDRITQDNKVFDRYLFIKNVRGEK